MCIGEGKTSICSFVHYVYVSEYACSSDTYTCARMDSICSFNL